MKAINHYFNKFHWILNVLVVKILLVLFLLLFNSCSLCEKKSEFALIEFERLNINLNEIKINDSVEFNFKNLGNSILRINKVNPSCGCTIPEWITKPIESGENGIIKVTYYSKYTKQISEDIIVYYNGINSPVKLTISGEVVY